METQELNQNPEQTEVSLREQLHQEIDQVSDEVLASTLDFLLFLKSRYSELSNTEKYSSTAKSILKTLENIGKWEGDDFEECLEFVHASRSTIKVATDENETEELKVE
ncbi:MAG: hypothetical protein WBA13_02420 [Microcoleaceae cyanobacterium]